MELRKMIRKKAIITVIWMFVLEFTSVVAFIAAANDMFLAGILALIIVITIATVQISLAIEVWKENLEKKAS